MYYEANGIKLYYEVYGTNNKNVILILPGWGNNRKTFENMISILKETNKVFIIDIPGFGSSPLPNKDLTIYDYADIIKDFITNLNITPTIISHSFGGRISIILTGKYNLNIKKLVLIDIAGIRRKSIKRFINRNIYKIRKRLVYLIPKEKRVKYLINLRRIYSSNDYLNLNKTMYKTFKNIINEDLRKYVKNINNKTLILWGSKDIDTPIKDSKFYHKHIKNSNLIIFKNKSHFVYLEEPSINNIILNFISK